MRLLSLLSLCLIFYSSCSKSGVSNPPITFSYIDNQTSDTVKTSVPNGYIKPTVDAFSGESLYLFQLDGPSSSTLHFSFAVDSLVTGNYSFAVINSPYPAPLEEFVWEYRDGTALVADVAYVSLTITNSDKTKASGQFNVHYRSGPYFATIIGGSFSNLPIKGH
ncbi:MAG TPA: hypothetical protein VG052_00120 [Puia sp.]|jgi:hypothetical protein|nr:hypothetical protein [Puia sp.]